MNGAQAVVDYSRAIELSPEAVRAIDLLEWGWGGLTVRYDM